MRLVEPYFSVNISQHKISPYSCKSFSELLWTNSKSLHWFIKEIVNSGSKIAYQGNRASQKLERSNYFVQLYKSFSKSLGNFLGVPHVRLAYNNA